jgi:hypothetical protein
MIPFEKVFQEKIWRNLFLKFRKFSSDLIFSKNDDIFSGGLVRENQKIYYGKTIYADSDCKILKPEISSKNDDI